MMTNQNESASYNLTVRLNYDLDCLERTWFNSVLLDEEFDQCSIANRTEDDFDAFYFYQVYSNLI